MNEGKTVAFPLETCYGPSLSSGELARTCEIPGHKAVESRYSFHVFRVFQGDNL